MLKIAVFAPIPKARVSTATAVKPGDLNNIRDAYRMSCNSVFMFSNSYPRKSCSRACLLDSSKGADDSREGETRNGPVPQHTIPSGFRLQIAGHLLTIRMSLKNRRSPVARRSDLNSG